MKIYSHVVNILYYMRCKKKKKRTPINIATVAVDRHIINIVGLSIDTDRFEA